MIGTASTVLSAHLSAEIHKALRCGVPIENVIATLLAHAEILQAALPVTQAVLDGQRGSPCG